LHFVFDLFANLLHACAMAETIRIIGIDPGLGATGWGVIASAGNRLSFLASGTIATGSALALGARLRLLHEGLSAALAHWQPDEASVEATFVNRDGAATLKLGQARGVAMLAAAQVGIPIGEYAPNLVKKSVTGTGHAEKTQIRAMVRLLLPTAEFGSEHAADALAIAICHAHHRSVSAAALGPRMRVSA
jgi:crossover junction endodeoxyribonuclease RuvC